jgi:ribosomal-protein-alanine N-acetyltransferase
VADVGLPTLAGPRLALRQLAAADAGHLFTVFSDPRVMRYWSRGPFTGEDEARALLAMIERGWREDAFYQWGVVPAETGFVIGTATLFRIEREHRRAELGFAIGSAWWGRGFGAAAVSLLVEHAFGSLGLCRLEADVDPRNTPSLRLLDRFGFRREGLLRERYRVAGEVQDSVILGLLDRDWRAR